MLFEKFGVLLTALIRRNSVRAHLPPGDHVGLSRCLALHNGRLSELQRL